MPRSMASTFAASESTPMARTPRAAIAATIGAPSFPKPMTLTLIGMTLPDTMFPSGRLRGETRMPAQALLQHTQERRGHPMKIPFLRIHAHTCFSSAPLVGQLGETLGFQASIAFRRHQMYVSRWLWQSGYH